MLRFLYLLAFFSFALFSVASESSSMRDLDAQKELLLQKIDNNRDLTQKDFETVKARIDAVDKRMDDQVNRAGDIGLSVDRLATAISWGGFLVALILPLAGFIGYFSVTRQAVYNAKLASKKWFDDNKENLAEKLHGLEEAAQKAHQEIDSAVNNVASCEKNAILQIQENINLPNKKEVVIDTYEKQALHLSAEQAKERPESSYSFEDWNKRAFDAYQSHQLDVAAIYWKYASEIKGVGGREVAQSLFNRMSALLAMGRDQDAYDVGKKLVSSSCQYLSTDIRDIAVSAMYNMTVILYEQNKLDEVIATSEEIIAGYAADKSAYARRAVAAAMNAKAGVLEKMDKPAEAIDIYDQLISKYSPDESFAMSVVISSAKNGKGYTYLMNAKKKWGNNDLVIPLLNKARADLLAALDLCGDNGLMRGNLAYVLWLLGDRSAAEESFRIALDSAQRGGKELYTSTLDDVARNEVQQEDEAFRKMVERLWAEHQSVKTTHN